jgi:hypothetical protein
MIQKSDIITCESYKGLCDYIYKPEKTTGGFPLPGIVHVNMEELLQFFEAIEGSPYKYVVVSSCSDFGLCYQERSPVWVDMPKWARMMVTPEVGYNSCVLSPRCDLERCNPNHKYSAKCYSYTAYTFPAIPDNVVHWFITNSRIFPNEENDRITVIPFGVAPGSADDIIAVATEVSSYEKEPKTYINWVNYTLERVEIREYYRMLGMADVTIVDDAKPYKSYLRDLARHATILSPEGNGVDCYRMLESIYMGSMPIVGINPVTVELRELPIIISKSLYGLRPNEMYSIYHQIKEQGRSLDKVKLSYWKNQFESKRNLL